MEIFKKILILTSVAVLATAMEEAAESQDTRDGKSLLGVFPFNDQHHAHHDHDHGHHDQDGIRADRQQSVPALPDLSIGAIAAAGERCIEKVVMETHTEYDDVVTCKHSYSEECHTTYVTDFEPTQEQECDETFTKTCHIEYKKAAKQEKVTLCHTPLHCDGHGVLEWITVYESHCTTTYHEHDVVDDVPNCQTIHDEKCEDVTQGYTTERKCHKWPRVVCNPTKEPVTKRTPHTWCEKKPRQVQVPGKCTPQPQPEVCHDELQTIVVEVPQEQCDLEPQEHCKHVTKLVPHLRPVKECVDVPKEVCARSRGNPRRVPKPVIKKWCYVPTAESGLAGK